LLECEKKYRFSHDEEKKKSCMNQLRRGLKPLLNMQQLEEPIRAYVRTSSCIILGREPKSLLLANVVHGIEQQTLMEATCQRYRTSRHSQKKTNAARPSLGYDEDVLELSAISSRKSFMISV
jgi:hypothetical protein